MKIRQITAGITICILAFIMITLTYINKSGEENIPDMVWYNEEITKIEEELLQGATREAIEQAHGCIILFIEDSDYQSRLNEYLIDGSMILDLCRKEENLYREGGIENDAAESVYVGKAVWQIKKERYHMLRGRLQRIVIASGIVLLAVSYGLLLILYLNYIKPFRELQEFTTQIAKGNLELPLPIRRNNFFGALQRVLI